MLDIKFIRENPDLVKKNIKKKFQDEKLKFVDEILAKDEQWRRLKFEIDNLRKDRNVISEEINKLKKNNEAKKVKELIKKARDLPEKIKESEERFDILNRDIRSLQVKIPNIISNTVPIGKSDADNVVGKIIGKPKKKSVKSHVEIIENLGLGDFESSARVSGTGFYYLEGRLALLNQALLSYARNIMVKKGFTYIETPLLLRESIIDKVTDIKDKQLQIYLVDDEPKMALIGTSEHSLIGRYVGTEIEEKKLPIKQSSYSMCFRKEIGAHGIDERGLFRTHQFNKIEMIVICKPDDSERFFKEMQLITIEIFKGLEIPIRVLHICSGDLGDLKYEQVDIEAYSPRKDDYFEVGSCSNLTEAQARKLDIFSRNKNGRFVPHTLNNTALASSRALVALLENHQQKDGSILIPQKLWKYTGFKEIKKVDH